MEETNLLQETIAFLVDYDKSPDDVQWVGSPDFGWFSWEEFEVVGDVVYNSGYGCPEVAQDLVVVGELWWLERVEFEGGRESWRFKVPPERPTEVRRVPDQLVGGQWSSLLHINRSSL